MSIDKNDNMKTQVDSQQNKMIIIIDRAVLRVINMRIVESSDNEKVESYLI